MEPCRVPPVGWSCTRGAGHSGPCAASQSLQSWSERASEWAVQTFGMPEPQRAYSRTREEFRELEERLMAPGTEQGGELMSVRAKKAAEEAADVCICLAQLVRSLSYKLQLALGPHAPYLDLDNEIELKMNINQKRKWQSNGDGTGYHVKEPACVAEQYDDRG